MTAIQINLWDGQPVAEPIQKPALASIDPIRKSAASSFELAEDMSRYGGCPRDMATYYFDVDPCRVCPLHDWCGVDDCAIHYFNLDVNEPEPYDFEEWRDALP